MDPVLYIVGADDRLIHTGGAWDRAARAAGAPHLVGAERHERVLWSYIASPTLVDVYRALFAQARTGRRIRVQFPGESTGREQRVMVLDIVGIPGGGVACHSYADPAGTCISATVAAEGSGEPTLVECSWCRKFRVDGSWVPADDAVERQHMFLKPLPNITHGLCPECSSAMGTRQ